MIHRTTRRELLRHAAIAGTAGAMMRGGGHPVAGQDSPNERIRFACIGVGGKGNSDTNDAGKFGEVVALCDCDEETLDKMAAQYPRAKKYVDYRKMLEELGDKIDAVTVSTPDHTHAPAGAAAMRMGKHAFIQKPLTWSVEEARILRALAAEKRLCTQMGNQGTAADGFRRGVEVIRSGTLGPVREILVWTNRPIWPQGIARPSAGATVPKNVHWDEFLGAAPDRPYDKAYHPFAWRGWLDFGTGALGDMACHTINVAAMALQLFDPESVEVVDTSGIVDRETYPAWSVIKTHFGQRDGRGPIDLTWYDGGDRLPKERKSEIQAKLQGEAMPGSGLLLIGEKGAFFSTNDYGAEHVLLPRDRFEDQPRVEATLPHSPGHFREFVEAIKANDPSKALSNFDYAGRLTETMLLGVVALKVGGKIEWDPAAMKVKDKPEADQYLKRDYRKGFSVHANG